jgi:RimJ/RimL family protein N-acetyltransferase
MEFYPADAPVPECLRTAEFLLRPLRPADNALDYEAVMATQETLRLGGDWPRPDFTLEENRADLAGHEADFSARTGFTYTVLEPDGTRCLGCVYIYPRDRVLQSLGTDEAAIAAGGDHDAVAWFWVRPDGVARDLDRRLLAALLPWLRDDFAFARLAFWTWAADERQAAVLGEAGLRPVWSHPNGNTVALFFA